MAASDSVLAMLRAAEVNERVLTAEVERLTLLADARAVALAQMQQVILGQSIAAAKVKAFIEQNQIAMSGYAWENLREWLAQPDPDQRGASILAAGDRLVARVTASKWCSACGTAWSGKGTEVEFHDDGCPADAYRRLRGATTSAGGEG